MKHGPATRVDARRADENRDAARAIVRNLGDHGRRVERLLAETKSAARDRWDERHLVAVGELTLRRRVRAVHGVEQTRRLLAELEPWPHVANAVDAVEIALRPSGPLAQAGEESHADLHHDDSRHYDRRAGSRAGRWCYVELHSHVTQPSG